MKKITTILVAALIGAALPLTLHAEEQVSSRDAKFLRKAAEGNSAEIQMGQMVAQRTQDQQVRNFAEKIVRDHTQANQQLQQIAQAKGIDLPQNPAKSDQRTITRLENLSGPQLDREAIDHWVKDHKKDIKEYNSEAKRARDPQVKQFAISTLPTLRDHLNNAETLQNGVIREPAGASHNQMFRGGGY
jgi:putative membrane protein